MGFLSKILGASSHGNIISQGQYHGRYGEDSSWDFPTTSSVIDAGSDYFNEDIDRAIALSLAEEGEEERDPKRKADEKGKKAIDHDHKIEEDEQLAKALQESLNMETCARIPPWLSPQYGRGSLWQPYPFFPYGFSVKTCSGCHGEIGHGRYFNCMGGYWHPQCLCCHGCNEPISDHEYYMLRNLPYHKSCYKELHHPRCDVCTNFIPSNRAGLVAYKAHPFWMQKYCPSHECDGTPRCCSCERMEPSESKYLILGDSRKLCFECLDSAIMDTNECQPLYIEIQEFYEGLNMKVEQEVPLLLVERQALNEAIQGEKQDYHHLPETRGLCLSEEQTVRTIMRRPRFGRGYGILDMITEPYTLVRHCEVTAILILFGLPRLLTGSILAHEMMHAWLRLNGYPNLKPEVEEGICQVLAHIWLESEILAGISSTTSSSSSSGSISSKKGKRSQFERKLGEFFKNQIESDASAAYGDGFRTGNRAVNNYGLRETLYHIRLTGTFPS